MALVERLIAENKRTCTLINVEACPQCGQYDKDLKLIQQAIEDVGKRLSLCRPDVDSNYVDWDIICKELGFSAGKGDTDSIARVDCPTEGSGERVSGLKELQRTRPSTPEREKLVEYYKRTKFGDTIVRKLNEKENHELP